MNKKSAEEIAQNFIDGFGSDGFHKGRAGKYWYISEDGINGIDLKHYFTLLVDYIQEDECLLTTQKENDPPNPLNYPTRCYCGHTDWCECAPKQGEEKCPTCRSICQVGGKEGETKYFIPKEQKGYSLEDMRKAFKEGVEFAEAHPKGEYTQRYYNIMFDRFIESLQDKGTNTNQ